MGIDKYVYAVGDATYTAMVSRLEKQSKGYNAISLTNYDATTVCQIADGSVFEVAGSVYLATADTSITGSVATGICYIMATGATATASVAWSTTAPVWRDDFQGYYQTAASSVRAIGGCHFDGSAYELKFAYHGRDTGAVLRHIQAPMTGYTDSDGDLIMGGDRVTINNVSTGTAVLGLQLPRRFVVTQLETYCSARSAGTANVTLYYCSVQDASETAMATTSHTAGSDEQTDTSITKPVIDEENNKYFVWITPTATTTATISQVEIQGYEMI